MAVTWRVTGLCFVREVSILLRSNLVKLYIIFESIRVRAVNRVLYVFQTGGSFYRKSELRLETCLSESTLGTMHAAAVRERSLGLVGVFAFPTY